MTNEKTRYRVVKNMGKYSLQRYIEPKTVEYYDTVRYWWGKRRELIKRNMKGEWAYRDWETDRKSTRLNSSHLKLSRMPSSA